MRKILNLFFCGTFIVLAQETTLSDVVRLSNENLTGTARFRAMGGAFGAVGGDLSAINTNPAGSTLFNNNVASMSMTIFNRSNNTSYFGSSIKNNDGTVAINQIGGAFVFENDKKNWNKFVLAFNYDNQNKFDNFYTAQGFNDNSIDEYFLGHAQGIPLREIENQNGINEDYRYLGEQQGLGFSAQQAYLAYESLLIEAFTNQPTENRYYTNVPYVGGNFFHKNIVENIGYNGKLAVNLASSVNKFLDLGVNLNFHFVDIIRNTSLRETNNNGLYTSGQTVKEIVFRNNLYTRGSGFSLNLGAILRPTKFFRLGLNYETSTWYRLNDELSQSLFVASNNFAGNNSKQALVAPDVINVYPEYQIQTPQKLGLSGAFIINKKGVISVDYIRTDYSKSLIKPTSDSFFKSINDQAKNELKNTNEFRIGGEYRIKALSLRGGYRMEESPYKNKNFFGDYTATSAGLGYVFGGQRIDIAYTLEKRKYGEFFLSSGFNGGSINDFKSNNLTISYTLNF